MIQTALRRVCGLRKLGKAYLVTNLSSDPSALPLEHFLFDPVKVIPDIHALGMSAQGLALLEDPERPGIYNVWDWIGGEYELWDYLEEGRAYGFSTLAPMTLDFSKITRQSRRICVFPHAALANALDFTDQRLGRCPTGREACANQGGQWCVGLPREAMPGEHAADRSLVRVLPSGLSYKAWAPPTGVQPQWLAAAACWLPISKYEVIRDPLGGHQEAMDLLARLNQGLPLTLEDS